MNEEVRVMQVKNLLRTYYIVNDANSFDITIQGKAAIADQALEALLWSLMTEEEYYHFMDCNEFQGEHWFEFVKDYLELKEANEEKANEEERKQAKEIAAREGLREVTKVSEYWSCGVKSWIVWGTMYNLDPNTYENGCSPMIVRVTNGKIDLVDGQ